MACYQNIRGLYFTLDSKYQLNIGRYKNIYISQIYIIYIIYKWFLKKNFPKFSKVLITFFRFFSKKKFFFKLLCSNISEIWVISVKYRLYRRNIGHIGRINTIYIQYEILSRLYNGESRSKYISIDFSRKRKILLTMIGR